MPRDLYDVLGVPGAASEAEIRHAFHVLAKKYHPDVNPGSADAARRFVEVGDAAATLLDPGRRARYDESRMPRIPARAPAATPKPPPPPPSASASTAQARRKSPAAAPEPVGQRPDGGRWSTLKAVAVIAWIAVFGWWFVGHPSSSSSNNKGGGMPTNGSVVWQAADFSLDDGWGINLAGNGARIQIFPGMSADIEFADGYLASAGQIALLPHGETLTYQHCVSAVGRAAGQSASQGEITPTLGSSLCVSGSGGDLASIRVTDAEGSSLTANITVWEYV